MGKLPGVLLRKYGLGKSTMKDDIFLVLANLSGTFYALDRKTGQKIWNIMPSASPITGSAQISQDTIFFGNESGNLYAVNTKGNVLWSHSYGGKLRGDIQVNGEQIFLAPMEGENLLVAVDMLGNQMGFALPKK